MTICLVLAMLERRGCEGKRRDHARRPSRGAFWSKTKARSRPHPRLTLSNCRFFARVSAYPPGQRSPQPEFQRTEHTDGRYFAMYNICTHRYQQRNVAQLFGVKIVCQFTNQFEYLYFHRRARSREPPPCFNVSTVAFDTRLQITPRDPRNNVFLTGGDATIPPLLIDNKNEAVIGQPLLHWRDATLRPRYKSAA